MTSEHDIAFSRAQEIVRAHVLSRGAELVSLADAVGRILARDVRARADHPPFTNSAMDGWALAAGATPGSLEVVGESAAGAPYDGVLGSGSAVVISTGAPLPDGADAVVAREDAAERAGHLKISEAIRSGAFVRTRGDDLRMGDVVLRHGIRIAPHHLAVAAGTGHAAISCVRRPRVAVVVSGRELVAVGDELGPGQIWNISSVSLPALITDAGGDVVFVRAISDDPAQTLAALEEALEGADIVITSGGVSIGDHDQLRPALARLGVAELFRGVRIRPGHPTWFGRRGRTRVLALPGNPVAAVVCFWVFGRTLLGRDDLWTALPLAADYITPTRRTDVIRCALGPSGLVPSAHQASHQVTSLADATHLAVVPEQSVALRKGAHLQAVSLTG